MVFAPSSALWQVHSCKGPGLWLHEHHGLWGSYGHALDASLLYQPPVPYYPSNSAMQHKIINIYIYMIDGNRKMSRFLKVNLGKFYARSFKIQWGSATPFRSSTTSSTQVRSRFVAIALFLIDFIFHQLLSKLHLAPWLRWLAARK